MHSRFPGRYTSLLLCSALLAFSFLTPLRAAPDSVPRYVGVAEQLVADLHDAPLNVYGDGKRHIEWETGHCEARTVCASFITLLLEHTYGWKDEDFHKWMGHLDPQAEDYYDAISNEDGFKRLHKVTSLRPGDLITIKYFDNSDDTGHVMLIDSKPQMRKASEPIEAGTTQYEVTIIDSSRTGHGSKDTRHKSVGGYTGGIGRGIFRLYADSEDKIVGYAWSTTAKSEYYTAPKRRLAIGRLTRKTNDTNTPSTDETGRNER